MFVSPNSQDTVKHLPRTTSESTGCGGFLNAKDAKGFAKVAKESCPLLCFARTFASFAFKCLLNRYGHSPFVCGAMGLKRC